MGLGIRTRLRRLRDGERIDDEYLEARAVTELLREPAAELVARARTTARSTSRSSSPSSARAAGGTRRSPTSCAAWSAWAIAARCGSTTRGTAAPAARPAPSATCGRGSARSRPSVHYGFDAWRGADVVVATGWQTVARVRVLPGAAARGLPRPGPRARVLRDLRAAPVGRGLLPPRAVPDHRRAVAGGGHGQRVRAAGDALRAGRRHRPLPPAGRSTRRDDVVLFYARASTPRRAVPIALVALGELKRRRPQTELWFYGHGWPPRVDYPFRNLGVVSGEDLARLYATATVGLVLSMTNYSLVPQEMLACGLPCVELDAPSVVAAFGRDSPIELAAARADGHRRGARAPARRSRPARAARRGRRAPGGRADVGRRGAASWRRGSRPRWTTRGSERGASPSRSSRGRGARRSTRAWRRCATRAPRRRSSRSAPTGPGWRATARWPRAAATVLALVEDDVAVDDGWLSALDDGWRRRGGRPRGDRRPAATAVPRGAPARGWAPELEAALDRGRPRRRGARPRPRRRRRCTAAT